MRPKLLASVLLCSITCLGQDKDVPQDLGERAVQEFRNDDWPAAERDFREVVKRDPTNVFAHMYLGQTWRSLAH